MRGPVDVLFAFKIFSLPVPTRPGTRTFWQVPDPSRPEVKNPYPSDPVHRRPDRERGNHWSFLRNFASLILWTYFLRLTIISFSGVEIGNIFFRSGQCVFFRTIGESSVRAVPSKYLTLVN